MSTCNPLTFWLHTLKKHVLETGTFSFTRKVFLVKVSRRMSRTQALLRTRMYTRTCMNLHQNMTQVSCRPKSFLYKFLERVSGVLVEKCGWQWRSIGEALCGISFSPTTTRRFSVHPCNRQFYMKLRYTNSLFILTVDSPRSPGLLLIAQRCRSDRKAG